MNLFEDLSASQQAAVAYCDGPSLVVAGAGSGKTRVLTYKIAYLLTQGYQPWRVMALTFTNKAAREMKERIAALIGQQQAAPLWMGTFHSIFLRILRHEIGDIPFSPGFTIYTEAESQTLMKNIIREAGLDEKTYKPGAVLSVISKAKAMLIDAESYATENAMVEADARGGQAAIAQLYQHYAERLRRANAMDFDDILLFTYQLFEQHEDVRQRYAQRFQFLLVDEYQDTNFAQHEIVFQLARDNQRLCVVGDDAQSIYSFRGARIDNILQFRDRYPGAQLFKLEQNYRSTQMIVNAANSLIHKNTDQIDKTVFSKNAVGERICITAVYNDLEERSQVIGRIKSLHRREHASYAQMAILYRTHAQSRVFEEELLRQGIPYRIYGGISFYQRKEIKDIIAYFRLVCNASDEEAFRRIINVPKRGIGDTTLSKIAERANAHGASLYAVISQPDMYGLVLPARAMAKVEAFHQLIESCRQVVEAQDCVTAGIHIIEASGIKAELEASRDLEDKVKQENVNELVAAMTQFTASRQSEGGGHATLTEYLSEVSLLATADTPSAASAEDDGSEGAVSLMTVHAAKGLEFDTVFIVGMENELFPGERSLSLPRALQEERRLFYVAITRARTRCYISYTRMRFRNGVFTPATPSLFLADIDGRFVERSRSNDRPGPVSRSDDVRLPWMRPASAPRQQSDEATLQRFSRPVRREVPLASASRTDGLRPLRPTENLAAAPRDKVAAGQGYRQGMRVKHERFGFGTVVGAEGVGMNAKLTVKFDTGAQKQLLVKYAPLTIVSS